MKIRTDFVTNTSSVSFIITMPKPMVDLHRQQHSGSRTSEKMERLAQFPVYLFYSILTIVH